MAWMTYAPYVRSAGALAYGAYRSFPSGQKQTYAGTRSTNRLYTKKKPINGYRYSFKKKMLGNTPAKHYLVNDNQTFFVSGTHNTIYSCNITAGVVQGTADNQRIGDAIQIMALKVNALLGSNSALTASTQFRVLVGWSGEELNVPNTLSSAGLSAAQIFHAGTGTSWANTGIINPKAFTVIHDRIHTLNNSIANVSDIEQVAFTVPCSTAFPYQAAGSIYGKTRNLYLVVIPCSFGGSSGVTVAGSCSLSLDLIYKQL